MDSTARLRLRISHLLFASRAIGALAGVSLVAACGAKVAIDRSTSGGTGGGGSGTGGEGAGTTTTTTTSSSSTGTGAAPPTCGGGTATEECFSPPPDGSAPADCAPASTVENSCCNTAVAGPFAQGGQCCYWFCEGPCCGRAFTVDGRARVAGVAAVKGWSRAAIEGDLSSIPEGARAALAEAWSADAQMEHASVASFARFTLELLALGAPADLVEASQRAALDEIEHARLCFGIASRLGGRALGPTALDLRGALGERSLADCAASAVREGCIGETVAAIMARAQLARAEDEGVRRALDRIAEDEEAHAALAWRFVAWALETGGDDVRIAVAQAFEAGTCALRWQRAEPSDEPADLAWLHRFGRLAPAEVDRVTRSALDDVIAPSAALLARPPAEA